MYVRVSLVDIDLKRARLQGHLVAGSHGSINEPELIILRIALVAFGLNSADATAAADLGIVWDLQQLGWVLKAHAPKGRSRHSRNTMS